MSAVSHADAKARARQAQQDLDSVHSAKRKAALKDVEGVGGDYAAKARGERWIGANAFDQRSTGRTTD